MTDTNLQGGAIVANQNSQYVSIIAENGEQFNPRQKIIFNIEGEIGYIKNDSYIVFDILNNSADKGRFTLQKNLGAHAIIDRVDIYSKETGILLESNTNYCEWLNVMNQYMYDDPTNLQNHQGVGKPVQSWTHQPKADGSAVASSRSIPSPIDIENNQLSPLTKESSTEMGDPAYTTRRFCIPLMCGLFGAYEGGQEKAIPVMSFGGLRIEITLQPPKLALQQLGCVKKNTGADHNAFFADEVMDWVEGIAVAADTTASANQSGQSTVCYFLVDAGTTLAGFRENHLGDLGLCIGNKMTFTGEDSAGAYTCSGTVSAAVYADNVNLTVHGAVVQHKRLAKITLTGIGKAGANAIASGTLKRVLTDASYKVMNTEFRLKQLVAPDNVADAQVKEGISYEYLGYEMFMNNIPISPLRHQIPINSVASKAVATFTILHDTSNGEGEVASSCDVYNGALPDQIHLNEVVYWINNRLYPLRSYNPQVKGDRVLNTNELVKALRALGTQPANLGNADFGDLENYTNTPMVCRELARAGMVFDLRTAEPELRLGFSAARTSILRANTFVFSKKIIQTTATGLQVIH